MKGQSKNLDRYYETVTLPIRRSRYYESVMIPIRGCVNTGKVEKRESPFDLGMIRYSLVKLVALTLITSLCWVGPSIVGLTSGYFNDAETSSPNLIGSASLIFSLSSGDWDSSGKITPGGSIGRTIDVVNQGTIPFQYNASAVKTGGNDPFCNALKLSVKLNENSIYTDVDLMSFISAITTLAVAGTDQWLFTVSLPERSYNSETCEFKFIFNGWQKNIALGGGFSDTKGMPNSVYDPLSGEEIPVEPTPDPDNEKIDEELVNSTQTLEVEQMVSSVPSIVEDTSPLTQEIGDLNGENLAQDYLTSNENDLGDGSQVGGEVDETINEAVGVANETDKIQVELEIQTEPEVEPEVQANEEQIIDQTPAAEQEFTTEQAPATEEQAAIAPDIDSAEAPAGE